MLFNIVEGDGKLDAAGADMDDNRSNEAAEAIMEEGVSDEKLDAAGADNMDDNRSDEAAEAIMEEGVTMQRRSCKRSMAPVICIDSNSPNDDCHHIQYSRLQCLTVWREIPAPSGFIHQHCSEGGGWKIGWGFRFR